MHRPVSTNFKFPLAVPVAVSVTRPAKKSAKGVDAERTTLQCSASSLSRCEPPPSHRKRCVRMAESYAANRDVCFHCLNSAARLARHLTTEVLPALLHL